MSNLFEHCRGGVSKTQSKIVKKYGYKIVSNNISLMINKGDIYGFVGKNGAGKTTFMRQVLGLAFPDRYYGDS